MLKLSVLLLHCILGKLRLTRQELDIVSLPLLRLQFGSKRKERTNLGIAPDCGQSYWESVKLLAYVKDMG